MEATVRGSACDHMGAGWLMGRYTENKEHIMLPAWQIAGRCGHREVNKNVISPSRNFVLHSVNLFQRPLFSLCLNVITRTTRSQHSKYPRFCVPLFHLLPARLKVS